MILRSNHPSSPSVSVKIYGEDVNYLSIQQVSLELEENNHDLLRIVMAGIPPKAITDYINAPVDLTIAQGATRHDFVGYISHIEPAHQSNQSTVNSSPFPLATIYCVGASFMMKPKVTKVWNNVSLHDIVQTLANKYQFSYAIPLDPFTFGRLTQDGKSDWEFLVGIADYLGYSVTCHGTHIHIFDRHKFLGRQISFSSLNSINNADPMTADPGTILSFRGSFGTNTPNTNVNEETMVTLDNRGKIVPLGAAERDSHMGRPLEPLFTDQLVGNAIAPKFGERLIASNARKKFPFQAFTEVSGVCGVFPGGIVDVQKFNSYFDGVWFVTAVTHTVTMDLYRTDISLLKDSTNHDAFTIPPTSSLEEPPISTLVNERWKALTSMEVTYG